MSKPAKFNHDISRSIHETVSKLHDAGIVSPKTMRKFDRLCLTPVRVLEADEIRGLREQTGASQAVFAYHLNVTAGMVSK